MRGSIAEPFRQTALVIALLLGAERIALGQDQSAATPKDEIFARKILMDSIDDRADALDWMLNGGKPFDFARAVGHADTISVMLMAFPHLFSPATDQWRPNATRDPGRDTYASPELWKNFTDFYQRAAAASQIAFKASRAKNEGEFRQAIAGLHNACDSCHAVYLKTDQ